MGSAISCITNAHSSSRTYVDDYIDNIIYNPPVITQTEIGTLNALSQCGKISSFFCYTKNNDGIAAFKTNIINDPINNQQSESESKSKSESESESETEKYIIFSHGNGCDIYKMCEYFVNLASIINACTNTKVNIICYDYIGYSISAPKTPSEQGCYDSLEAIMCYVQNNLHVNPQNIYLIGQSLGTGVVIDYVSKNKTWTTPIMLISPYKTICRVVLDSCCVNPIDKFTSIYKLQNITCPVKILHGEQDRIINISHGKEMYDKLINKSLQPVWFEDTDHNDIIDKILPDHYLEVLNYTAK